LSNYNGIIVPGGFGTRGSEGIIKTANFARENNIPYLGICFGFQLAAVAFGRYVCNLKDANSAEVSPKTEYPIIDLLPEQKSIENKGGSLRLGASEINVKENSIAFKIYNSNVIKKRHRHRYEFNKEFLDTFIEKGMVFSGESDNGKRMEILEIPSHKFFFGVQFHPEFNSRPGFPEKSFETFLKASSNQTS
jgi:CTP synthase